MTKPLLTGVLKTWKEDRGFGFITPDNGGRDIFIHISAIAQASRRPVAGDIIHYQVARDKHGKFRAINANIEGVTSADGKGGASLTLWLVAIFITLALIAGGVWYYLQQGGKMGF